MALVALAFVVLFKFTDALRRRDDGAVRASISDFRRNEYAAIIKGVGLAATLLGGFAGGFVARAYPLATSLWIGGILQAPPTSRSPGRPWSATTPPWLTVAIIAGEFHQRDRHGDLRRLPLGAVPEPAAHRDAICAAHRARRVRPHLSVGRRRLSSPPRPAGSGSSSICALAGAAEPRAALVAAGARAFRPARAGEA